MSELAARWFWWRRPTPPDDFDDFADVKAQDAPCAARYGRWLTLSRQIAGHIE